ncbi:hypothetical protein [Rothia nasisuis]|uniref:hypothetical protein n=1 Tax=Rothia nasisuis TaxID=2109647 RepID=UPI001F28604A|nr:hypothetical protein [Rothia nasisuis]
MENLFLNIGLYIGSLFVISAAALLVNSVATAPQQILLLMMLTLLMYATGLATYRYVRKLRLASYSFTATGLALIPFCGVAVYNLIWPYSGALLWLIVSIIGTVAVFGGLALMQARVMSYLALAYIVSDVLAVSKTMQVGLIWYFVALLLVATLIAFYLKFRADRLPTPIAAGFLDGSRVFVPGTVAATLLAVSLEYWEVSIIAALATAYAVSFMDQRPAWLYYLQARLYSLVAVGALSLWGGTQADSSVFMYAPPALLLIATSLVLLYVRLPRLPWRVGIDAAVTWLLAQPFMGLSLLALAHESRSHATFFETSPLFSPLISVSKLSDHLIIGLLCLVDVITLGLLAMRTRWSRYLPFIALALTWCVFFVLPPIPLVATATALGLLCILAPRTDAYASTPDGRTSTGYSPVRWAQAGTLLFTATGILALELLPGSPRYLALILLSAGMATSHLIAELDIRRSVNWSRQNLPGIFTPQTVTFFALLAHAFATVVVLTSTVSLPSTALNRSPESVLVVHAAGLGAMIGLAHAAALLTLERALIQKTAVYDGRRPGSAEPLGLLLVFYIFVAICMLAFSTPFELKNELLALALAAVGPVVLLAITGRALRPHLMVVIRIYAVYAVLRMLFALDLEPSAFTLTFLSLVAFMSLTSLLLIRNRPHNEHRAEYVTGLVCGWGSATVGLMLLDTAWNPYTAIGSLVLIALALAWIVAQRLQTVLAMQATLIATGLTIGLFTLLRGLTSASDTLVSLALTLLIMATTKGWSGAIPAVEPLSPTVPAIDPAGTPHQSRTPEPDPLGRWGYLHNLAMALTGLIISSFTGGFVYFTAEDTWLAVVASVLLTAGWFLQAPPRLRSYVLVFGLNAAILRLLISSVANNHFFYVIQCLVLSSSLLALISLREVLPTFMRPARSASASGSDRGIAPGALLFWIAFTLQAIFTLLWLPVALSSLSTPDKVLMLLVTGTVIGASAVAGKRLAPILATALITIQLLQLLGGLSIWSLFLVGFALIGLVVWRLLARSDDDSPGETRTEAPALTPVQQQSAPLPQQQVTPPTDPNQGPIIPWARG